MTWITPDTACVIVLGGRSSRFGGGLPKDVTVIAGKPLFHHVVDFWKPLVERFVFVMRYNADLIVPLLPPDSQWAVAEGDGTVTQTIGCAEPLVSGKCIVAFGDCVQRGAFDIPSGMGYGLGVWVNDGADAMRANYLVELLGGTVTDVEEKPPVHSGMGTYFLSSEVFWAIRARPQMRWTDLIGRMIRCGDAFRAVPFTGHYVNVNTQEDAEKAERMLG